MTCSVPPDLPATTAPLPGLLLLLPPPLSELPQAASVSAPASPAAASDALMLLPKVHLLVLSPAVTHGEMRDATADAVAVMRLVARQRSGRSGKTSSIVVSASKGAPHAAARIAS